MKSVPIPRPDEDLLAVFGNNCTRIFEYQEMLEQEIKTLEEVRDLLLRHLINQDAYNENGNVILFS